jgi:hypothetical protein
MAPVLAGNGVAALEKPWLDLGQFHRRVLGLYTPQAMKNCSNGYVKNPRRFLFAVGNDAHDR